MDLLRAVKTASKKPAGAECAVGLAVIRFLDGSTGPPLESFHHRLSIPGLRRLAQRPWGLEAAKLKESLPFARSGCGAAW